jgi:hypothetical protein
MRADEDVVVIVRRMRRGRADTRERCPPAALPVAPSLSSSRAPVISRALAAALAGVLSLETANARASAPLAAGAVGSTVRLDDVPFEVIGVLGREGQEALGLSVETAHGAGRSPLATSPPINLSSETSTPAPEGRAPVEEDQRQRAALARPRKTHLGRPILALAGNGLSFETAATTSAPPLPLAHAARPAPPSSLHLSFETPAPSARDLAYEQGQAAKEAGDDARAADEFARAYRLTPAGESGPRLMLLRESVDARLRAHERGAGARDQLCPARALLREHLAGASADPLADERARLARVEQGLRAVDCDAVDRPVPQDTRPVPPRPGPGDPPPTPTRPVPQDTSPATAAPAPSAGLAGPQRPAPTDMSPATGRTSTPGRGLRIAGVATLGVGAAALVPMSVGIAIARDAMRDGRRVCWEMDIACDGGTDRKLLAILERGQQADVLVKIAAPIAGVALLTGLVLLSVGLAARPRRPLAVVPRFGPGTLGVGLQGRF